MALLVGVVALATPAPADAALRIRITFNGGVVTDSTAGDGNTGHIAGYDVDGNPLTGDAFGNEISVTATTNEPLGSPFARVSQTNISVNGGVGSFDLMVEVSDRDYDLPDGPATFSSSLSGTVDAGIAAADADFESAISATNLHFAGFPGPTGSQDFDVTVLAGTGAFSETATAPVFTTPPFSLTNRFVIDDLSLPDGSSLQLTGTTTVTAVPAPPAVFLALTGLPVFGFGLWRRYRATRKA